MSDVVDELKAALGADTDTGLAAMLGLERSTIAQWRRRGAIPVRYQPALLSKPSSEWRQRNARLALRRTLYGDGQGRFLLSAALGVMSLESLEFVPEFSQANLGWSRESRILSVVSVILNACMLLFGRPRCDSHDDFVKLMAILEKPEWRRQIEKAEREAAVGEL